MFKKILFIIIFLIVIFNPAYSSTKKIFIINGVGLTEIGAKDPTVLSVTLDDKKMFTVTLGFHKEAKVMFRDDIERTNLISFLNKGRNWIERQKILKLDEGKEIGDVNGINGAIRLVFLADKSGESSVFFMIKDNSHSPAIVKSIFLDYDQCSNFADALSSNNIQNILNELKFRPSKSCLKDKSNIKVIVARGKIAAINIGSNSDILPGEKYILNRKTENGIINVGIVRIEKVLSDKSGIRLIEDRGSFFIQKNDFLGDRITHSRSKNLHKGSSIESQQLNDRIPLTIGISYNQIMEDLDQYISQSKSSDVRGQPRYMGTTSDSLVILEIIGVKKDISQATLMIGIPNDAPKILVRNTAILMRFMKNIAPEWRLASDWATGALKCIIATGETEEIIRGSKSIKISLIKFLGIVSVTVKHKNAI